MTKEGKWVGAGYIARLRKEVRRALRVLGSYLTDTTWKGLDQMGV